MGKDSMNLRDLFASVITGTTLNLTTSSATDLIRLVIDESGAPALKVSISGTTSSSGVFPGDVSVGGNLYVTGNTYQQDQYVVDELIIGDKSTLGSWRFIQNGNDLILEKLIDVTGATWATKSTFTGW